MIAEVVSRLGAAGRFSAVEVAESLEAVSARIGMVEDGAVLVVPWRERARPNRNITVALRQLIEVQFVVVMVARRHDDPNGAEKALGFDTFAAEVEHVLAGWPPLAGSAPCALVGSEVSGLGGGVSICVQTWQTSRFLTGERP